MEIIEFYNYRGEIHNIETEDGYVLEMHRINGKLNALPDDNKKIAFLQHGILSSSMDWLIAGPQNGLAFVLSDAGFDVWLGNSRGNKYSRKHKNPNVTSKVYWDFR